MMTREQYKNHKKELQHQIPPAVPAYDAHYSKSQLLHHFLDSKILTAILVAFILFIGFIALVCGMHAPLYTVNHVKHAHVSKIVHKSNKRHSNHHHHKAMHNISHNSSEPVQSSAGHVNSGANSTDSASSTSSIKNKSTSASSSDNDNPAKSKSLASSQLPHLANHMPSSSNHVGNTHIETK